MLTELISYFVVMCCSFGQERSTGWIIANIAVILPTVIGTDRVDIVGPTERYINNAAALRTVYQLSFPIGKCIWRVERQS